MKIYLGKKKKHSMANKSESSRVAEIECLYDEVFNSEDERENRDPSRNLDYIVCELDLFGFKREIVAPVAHPPLRTIEIAIQEPIAISFWFSPESTSPRFTYDNTPSLQYATLKFVLDGRAENGHYLYKYNSGLERLIYNVYGGFDENLET